MTSIIITALVTAFIVRARYKVQIADAAEARERSDARLLEDRRRAIATHFSSNNLTPPNTLEAEDWAARHVRGVSLNGVNVGSSFAYNISEGWVEVYEPGIAGDPTRRFGVIEVDFDFVSYMLDEPAEFLATFAPKGSATPTVNN